MVDYTSLGFTRESVCAPTIDISHIRGNVSHEAMQLAAQVFYHFVSTRERSYGAEIGQRLKMVEVNVHGQDDGPVAPSGETIFEIQVEKDMCNIFGTLHGACAAYMIDPCSVSSLVALGLAMGVDGTGVSQSMHLIWHQPAPLGANLRIISRSVFIHGRIRSARCEIWNGSQLCISAVHSTVNPLQKGFGAKSKL